MSALPANWPRKNVQLGVPSRPKRASTPPDLAASTAPTVPHPSQAAQEKNQAAVLPLPRAKEEVAPLPGADEHVSDYRRSPPAKRRRFPQLALGLTAAARAVDLHPSSISREIQAGRLRAKRFGKRVLVLLPDLKAWLNGLPDAGRPATRSVPTDDDSPTGGT